jgi:hypothetical protein
MEGKGPMKKSLMTLLTLGLILTIGQASAFVFSIENGLTSQTIDPLAKAESAATYYDYGSLPASGTPDFGTVSNTGILWLYEDTSTNILSLGMIFDTTNDGSGGTVTLATSGMPGTTYVSVEDDGADVVPSNIINGTENWTWIACCTDGAMVSGLEDSTWTIAIDLLSSTGINDWLFLDGPDATNPTQIALDMSGTLYITATSVPEPEVFVLLSLGIVAMGFSHAQRRRKMNG